MTVPASGARQDGASRKGFLDRLGLRFMRHPGLFLLLVALGLILLPVAVWFDLRHLSNEALDRQASDLNAIISDIRAYYSRNVISPVTEADGRAQPVHNYTEVEGGIPIPATLSIELGDVVGQRGGNISYRFVSDYPFKGRAQHNLGVFELNALVDLRKTRDPQDRVSQIGGSLFERDIRMAVPVIMGTGCVSCHNTHPDSPKTDWKVGDVRGIQSVTITQPLAENLFSFRFLLIYLAGAAAIGAAFVALQWRQAVFFSGLSQDLEEANSFLAAISMKISKYLSPQVYRSIFSGERDAVIATERKKLTIFFSDIKDFTVTTERLQPEELTDILNEYFTEMAAIAHEHGATVDKFIGDAILAFVGDPETNGAKADALACVQMAIAMQKRLAQMNVEWRERGIEQPFRVRMGINTGYCNVGNFGSAERMDYTIIGAEANLAARLESIAEPGGIVMSYETYALVSDHVEAIPLEPISLKGISRQVVPYAVQNIDGYVLKTAADVLEATTDHLRLKLNLSNLDDAGRDDARRKLAEAMAALDRSGKTQT